MYIDTFLRQIDGGFFTGVPDSLLSPLGDRLIQLYGADGRKHIIAANEGNAVGLAAGYHLATGRVPVVYLQNSGVGNIINPVTSLLSDQVYGIPCMFVVGWRGRPGVHDEPQHAFMGKATLPLLEAAGIACFVLTPDTAVEELAAAVEAFRPLLAQGRSVAIVVEPGALKSQSKGDYRNGNALLREEAIACILKAAEGCPIVSTTGKASRELFELRESMGQGHGADFLTVGSMGHCSSIALEIALQKPERTVYCIDGDGAALMHLGALAVIAAQRPGNLIHIVINNGAHESVGGMPTAAGGFCLADTARSLGYPFTRTCGDVPGLTEALGEAKRQGRLSLIEARCAIGSRPGLGRPTTGARENKERFMEYLKDEKA